MWVGDKPNVRTLADSILAFGTEGYAPAVARRLKLVNGMSVAGIFFNLLWATAFFMLDARALWPAIMAFIVAAACFSLTPFLHRISDTAAVFYLAAVTVITLAIDGHLIGSSAGAQYFLLSAPAAMLVLGLERAPLAAGVTALYGLAFCYVEFVVPAASPLPPEVVVINKTACIAGALLMMFGVVYYALGLTRGAEAALEREYARSENLLLNLMPDSIARRLKDDPHRIIADQFDEVTILFADIVDFTPRASRLAPEEIVNFLNRVFSEFDRLAEKHKLEKIKTIGDAYMVAGGMPDRRTGHSTAVADMALDMLDVTRQLGAELNDDLSVRIGIHTGPAVAGVIGTRKLFYDVWGDTVNTAARMESHGSSGRIQVTEQARHVLGDAYEFEERGMVEIKGKGRMNLHYLVGRAR